MCLPEEAWLSGLAFQLAVPVIWHIITTLEKAAASGILPLRPLSSELQRRTNVTT